MKELEMRHLMQDGLIHQCWREDDNQGRQVDVAITSALTQRALSQFLDSDTFSPQLMLVFEFM